MDLNERFVTIKIERQVYQGKAALTIHIREVTKQIQVNMLNWQRQEQHLK